MSSQSLPHAIKESIQTSNAINYVAGPTAVKFHADAKSFVRVFLGPVGGGKTVACIMDIITKACMQEPYRRLRRTRWGIVRETYPELKNTTLKTWQAWVPDQMCHVNMQPPFTGMIKIDLPDNTRVEAEVIFLALDQPEDVKKLKSIEFTGIFINEVRYCDETVFLTCKERVGRYPEKKPDEGFMGATWSGIIGDTNAWATTNWLFDMFDKGAESVPEGHKLYEQPPAIYWVREEKQADGTLKLGHWEVNPDAENLRYLPANYYERQLIGGKDDLLRVELGLERGMSRQGKPVFPNYNEKYHVAQNKLEPRRGLPLILAFDWGLCYDDQTEVLTQTGWKFFKDIQFRDRIATKNPNTDKLEYHKPTAIVNKPYIGEMLEWKSNQLNMCVTPDHIIPCRRDSRPGTIERKTAQWISEHANGHWGVDVTSIWEPESWVDQKYYGMDANTLAEFMGLYLSEGSTSKKGNSHRISIAQKTQNPQLQEVLDRTGLPWKWYGKAWVCTNNQIGPWLHSLGGSWEKRIPRVVADMPREFLYNFIKVYTWGDGHVRIRENGSEEHTIFTVSERMAADLQEVAQKIGWDSSSKFEKGQTSFISENGALRKIVNTGGFRITFKKHAILAKFHAKNMRRVQYSGKVYCVTVPHNTIYVRRGGRVQWNGNCPAALFGQFMPGGLIHWLDALSPTDESFEEFLDNYVLPLLNKRYAGFKIHAVGDPAGRGRSALDKRTPYTILNERGIHCRPASTNSFIPRKEAVDWFLDRHKLLISPELTMVREAFSAGYFYAEMQGSNKGSFKEVPVKNHWSHIMDAGQYFSLFVKYGSSGLVAPAPSAPARTFKYA